MSYLLNDEGLKAASLLLGAEANQDSALKELKQNLLKTLNAALSLYYRDIDHSLPHEMTLEIVFTHLCINYPSLRFIKPILPQIIEPKIGILLDEPLAHLAHLSVRQWTFKKGIQPTNRSLIIEEETDLIDRLLQGNHLPVQSTYQVVNKFEYNTAQQMVLSCLRQETTKDSHFPRGLTKELRNQIIEEISNLDELNNENVIKAINKVVTHWYGLSSGNYFMNPSVGNGQRLGISPHQLSRGEIYDPKQDANPEKKEDLLNRRIKFFEKQKNNESKKRTFPDDGPKSESKRQKLTVPASKDEIPEQSEFSPN